MMEFSTTFRGNWYIIGLGLLTFVIFSKITDFDVPKIFIFFGFLFLSIFFGMNMKERCFKIEINNIENLVLIHSRRCFEVRIYEVKFKDIRWEYLDSYYNKGSMDKKLFIYDNNKLVCSFFRIDLGWHAKTVDSLVVELDKITSNSAR